MGPAAYRFRIAALSVGLLAASATAHADWNRNDAFRLVERTAPTLIDSGLRVHVNDGEEDPGVLVGDEIRYTLRADRARHFLLLLVDSRGAMTLVVPPTGSGPQVVFPAPGTPLLRQSEPMGVETVFAYVAERPVDPAALGLAPGQDIRPLPMEGDAIEPVIERLEAALADNPFDRVRYRYLVDAGVQFGTRADELTDAGRTQLDVLGSELLSFPESGRAPTVLLEDHTDDTGGAAYNLDLSIRRAEAARAYLVGTYGLRDMEIVAGGRGEAAPIVANVDGAARARNRRVEIRLAR